MEKYIKIKGMSCTHCKHKIEENFIKLKGIKKATVNLAKEYLNIDYDERIINDKKIIKTIKDLGYSTSSDLIYDTKRGLEEDIKYKKVYVVLTFFSIIALYFIIKLTTGFDFLSAIPEINSNISFMMLFVTGLLTSIHCIGMCGGILISASVGEKRTFKNPLLYNLGRLISYTLIGGIVGLIGSVFSINSYFQFFIIIFASIIMLLMGLSMLNLIPFRLSIKLPQINTNSKSPFIIGLLNGFMPCGALQSMQLYAVSTASFVLGALSMLLFVLGTIPLMMLVGILFNFFKGNMLKIFRMIGAVMIVLLSLVMFNRGLSYLEINSKRIKNLKEYNIAEVKKDIQSVDVNIDSYNYKKIIVEKGVPVKLNLKVKKDNLNGCNNEIIINKFNVKKKLEVGNNVIEFTPKEIGTYNYSCYMNMIKVK